jgi:hypothetical protein
MNQKLENASDKSQEMSERRAALTEATDPRTQDFNQSIAAMRSANENQEANDSLPSC